jgi:hypothetical protein
MATNYTINGKHFGVKYSGRRGEVVFDLEETEAEFESRTKLEVISGDDGSAYLGRKAFNAFINSYVGSRAKPTHVLFACDEHGDC